MSERSERTVGYGSGRSERTAGYGSERPVSSGSRQAARYPLARAFPPTAPRLDLAAFSRAAGLHPDVVRRYVALGLLEAVPDPSGRPTFTPAQLLAVARIQRLRAGFALNYAAVGLLVDLLDRIAELESALGGRTRTPAGGDNPGGRPWTPTA